MPKYLAISDIYISASFSDGTSVSLIEAMSMSKPVIVSDIASNKEWISDNHNGYLCSPGNSYDISLKIAKLLKNKEKQKKFGENNLRIARKTADWKVNTDKLHKLYTKMIKNVS